MGFQGEEKPETTSSPAKVPLYCIMTRRTFQLFKTLNLAILRGGILFFSQFCRAGSAPRRRVPGREHAMFLRRKGTLRRETSVNCLKNRAQEIFAWRKYEN